LAVFNTFFFARVYIPRNIHTIEPYACYQRTAPL
jgi:hypothetical protein